MSRGSNDILHGRGGVQFFLHIVNADTGCCPTAGGSEIRPVGCIIEIVLLLADMELPAGVDGAVSYRVRFVRRYAITAFNRDLLGGTVDGVPLASAGGGLVGLIDGSCAKIAPIAVNCTVIGQSPVIFDGAVVGQRHAVADGEGTALQDGQRLASFQRVVRCQRCIAGHTPIYDRVDGSFTAVKYFAGVYTSGRDNTS